MSKALYMTTGNNLRKTLESVKACVAHLAEAGLPGQIEVTSPDVQELRESLKALVFEIKSDPTVLGCIDARLLDRAEAALKACVSEKDSANK